MKKLTQIINENLSEQTWSEVLGDGSDIDFVNCDKKGTLEYLSSGRKLGRGYEVNRQITVYEIMDYILVCKCNDALAIMTVYEMYGWNFFKTIVIMYGHEDIVIYDTDDFQYKRIRTR